MFAAITPPSEDSVAPAAAATIEYARALTDGQLDARPVLGRPRKDPARLVEIIASIEYEFDPQAVPRPLLDLVEVVAVGVVRVVG